MSEGRWHNLESYVYDLFELVEIKVSKARGKVRDETGAANKFWSQGLIL